MLCDISLKISSLKDNAMWCNKYIKRRLYVVTIVFHTTFGHLCLKKQNGERNKLGLFTSIRIDKVVLYILCTGGTKGGGISPSREGGDNKPITPWVLPHITNKNTIMNKQNA